MDSEKWKTYTIFCFIRHPYERCLSGWKHIKATLPNILPFETYLMQNKNNVTDIEYAHVFMSQKNQIQDVDGSCGVDIIGRFEYLEDDFRYILRALGFPYIIHTPKKINYSEKNNSETISLTVGSIYRLNTLFEDDLSTFHYKPKLLV
jgi:hypothetical protein